MRALSTVPGPDVAQLPLHLLLLTPSMHKLTLNTIVLTSLTWLFRTINTAIYDSGQWCLLPVTMTVEKLQFLCCAWGTIMTHYGYEWWAVQVYFHLTSYSDCSFWRYHDNYIISWLLGMVTTVIIQHHMDPQEVQQAAWKAGAVYDWADMDKYNCQLTHQASYADPHALHAGKHQAVQCSTACAHAKQDELANLPTHQWMTEQINPALQQQLHKNGHSKHRCM
jgi:hypothetical protein